jgi:hypothetical protein
LDLTAWLNDITGGQLLLWKVVLASIVFAQTGLQVFLAARLWGVSTVPPVPVTTASRAHRLNGRATLVLAVLVAISCLGGPAGPTSPTRVLLHSVVGSLVFLLLAAKYGVLKLVPGGGRFLPWIGSGLFVTFGLIWASSVGDYITSR